LCGTICRIIQCFLSFYFNFFLHLSLELYHCFLHKFLTLVFCTKFLSSLSCLCFPSQVFEIKYARMPDEPLPSASLTPGGSGGGPPSGGSLPADARSSTSSLDRSYSGTGGAGGSAGVGGGGSSGGEEGGEGYRGEEEEDGEALREKRLKQLQAQVCSLRGLI